MEIENFKEIIKKTIITIISGASIAIIIYMIVRIVPESPNVADLRYTLSALAQSLAAIFAIVMSLTLLVLRETSNRYSIKFIDLFLNPKHRYTLLFWGTSLCFLIAIGLNIVVLSNLDKINISDPWHSVKFTLFLSLYNFVLLFIYIVVCLVSLKPSGLMKWIIEEDTAKKLIKYVRREQEKDPLLDCKLLIERLISLDEKESFDKCLEIFLDFFEKIAHSKGIDKHLKEITMVYLINYLRPLTSKAIGKGERYVISIIRSFGKIASFSTKEELDNISIVSIKLIDMILYNFENWGKKDPIIENFDALINQYFGKVKPDLFDHVSSIILSICDNVIEDMNSKNIAEEFRSSDNEMVFWDRGGYILKEISEKIASNGGKAIRDDRKFILKQNFNKLVFIGKFLVENFNPILNYTNISDEENPLFYVAKGTEDLLLKAEPKQFIIFNQNFRYSIFPLLNSMARNERSVFEQFKKKYINVCNRFIREKRYTNMKSIIATWGNLLLENKNLSNERMTTICEGLREIADTYFVSPRNPHEQEWKDNVKLCVEFLIYAGIKFYNSEIREKIIKNIWEIDLKSKTHIAPDFVLNIFEEITEEKYFLIEKINKPQKDIEELVMEGPYEKLTEDEYKTFLRFKEDYFGKYK